MASRARQLSKLLSSDLLTVDVNNSRIGVNSTSPEETLDVRDSLTVGFDTSTTDRDLHIYSTQAAPVRIETTANRSNIDFKDSNTTSSFNVEVGSRGNNLYLEGRDNIEFITNTNQERMRITGVGGSVGIGTTIPNTILDVAGSVSVRNGDQLNGLRTSPDGKLEIFSNGSANNDVSITVNDTSPFNVGIGTSIPDERLHIFTRDDTPALEIEQGNVNQRAQIRFNSPEVGNGWIVGTRGGAEADHGHFLIYQANSTGSNGHLQFFTNNVHHFNMDHAGRIDHFSTDSNCYDIHTSESGAADTAFAIKNGASDITDGTNVMNIRADGDLENTNNSYGAISDAKLKENIVDASSQWNDIKSLQVRNYNFKESTGFSTHTQLGVVAQEIETISPGLVDAVPDLDNDGNDLGTVTKTVNYSVLYMKSVKALQEAMNRIETLETKVAALEDNL